MNIHESQTTSETDETLETTLPMISQRILCLFQDRQELSLVYQFIDVLYNLCSLATLCKQGPMAK